VKKLLNTLYVTTEGAGLRKDGEPAPDATDADALEEELGRRRPLLVGVFADQDADTINAICDDVGLDLPRKFFRPCPADLHIAEPQLRRALGQERCSARHRLHEHDRHVRAQDREHDSRQPGARAQISNPNRPGPGTSLCLGCGQ